VNIFDAFRLQAQFQPTAPAICAPGRPIGLISYGRLEALSNNAARHALAQGIKPGDTVAVTCADPVLHWILVLGLGRIGAVSLSSVAPSVPAECNVSVAISDIAGSVRNAARVIAADNAWIEGDGKPPAVDTEQDHRAIARIILTSGTTGHPKGVALSHEIIVRRLLSFNVAFGSRIPACTRSFLDPGIAANFGFMWGVYTLSRGGALFLRGRDAAETLQALTLYNVQCIIGSPGGLAEFLDYYERSPAFSSPFECVLSIASMLVKPLAERLRATLASHLVAAYGATEGQPTAGAPWHHMADIPGAVGYVTPGMIVQAADRDGRALPTGQEGLLRFRGPRCVDGYVGNPPGSDQFFRDGWFYPGDIGRVTEHDMMVVTGREKNIIDLGGNKISPEAVEAALMSYPGVSFAAALGVPNALGIEEVWAAVTGSAALDQNAMREHCARRLPPGEAPVRVVQITDIPRLAIGRVDRRKLQEILKSC
jgi:acyl-CoA synthetase (AMP-forming)/AMP-acid ligase II